MSNTILESLQTMLEAVNEAKKERAIKVEEAENLIKRSKEKDAEAEAEIVRLEGLILGVTEAFEEYEEEIKMLKEEVEEAKKKTSDLEWEFKGALEELSDYSTAPEEKARIEKKAVELGFDISLQADPPPEDAAA